MRANDVKIGKVYVVKVSGRPVPVQIYTDKLTGYKFAGINLMTGREILFRNARRLRQELTESVLWSYLEKRPVLRENFRLDWYRGVDRVK